MNLVLVRLLISLAIVCLPFLLLAIGSRKRQGALWLLFPIAGAVPGVLGALLVFAPLERALDARGFGHLKGAAVTLAGALLIVPFMAVMAAMSGNPTKAVGRLVRAGRNGALSLLVWSALGALWGALWHLSARIAVTLQLAHTAGAGM